jgi:hypothetical protein
MQSIMTAITKQEFIRGAFPIVQDHVNSVIPIMDTEFSVHAETPEGFEATFRPSRLDVSRWRRNRNGLRGGLSSDCMGRISIRFGGWYAEYSLRGWVVAPC